MIYAPAKQDSLYEADVRQYLSEIRRIPLLSPQEEQALALRCAQGDTEAIRTMVSANLRLVVSVAKEYAGRGVPLLDLIQEGSIGLLTAAKKFDPQLQFRFSTYATKWIRQGIGRYIQEHGSAIRVPGHTAELLRKVQQAASVLEQETGEMPDAQRIGEKCNMDPQKVEKLLKLAPEICSLDAPAGEDGTLGMLLEDRESPRPEARLVREELTHTLEILLSMLTERQRMVLRLHFGMEDGKCYSLEDISIRFGVSKERIRQVERQAMERLQTLGAGMGLEEFLNE